MINWSPEIIYALSALCIALCINFALLVLVAVWMWQDCKYRGADPFLWVVVLILSQWVGLLLYFMIARRQTLWQCAACGQRVPADARFCSRCGRPLRPEAQPVNYYGTAAPAPPAQALTPAKKAMLGLRWGIFILLGLLVISLCSAAGVLLLESGSTPMVNIGAYWTKFGGVNGNTWTENVNAISDGSMFYTIDRKDGAPAWVTGAAQTDGGEIILEVTQKDRRETYSLTPEETCVDLSGFEEGRIRLTVLHQGAHKFNFTLQWE